MNLLDYYKDPTNLTKGILGRLQFKAHEKRALEQVYELHAQFQQALRSSSSLDTQEIEEIAEELILQIQFSEIQRQKWKWVECMEREEQIQEYTNMKESDEFQRVTHEEIEQLLHRREELEKKLANKIEFDKQMETVRTQPSRKESTQRIADLELDIEALQRRIKEQQSKHDDQKLSIQHLLSTLVQFRKELQENRVLREELKKEYSEDPSSSSSSSLSSSHPPPPLRSISPPIFSSSSSMLLMNTAVTVSGEEEGEIHKKEVPGPPSLLRHHVSGGSLLASTSTSTSGHGSALSGNGQAGFPKSGYLK
ncbi:hypothetical protein HMI54_008006 [Coelomomyces lativittatus]|nr:hypothetical protein HMI56_003196 [Coelomomyces lativittatus]KAJ1503516.1 hypothetical protein HMI54_008006 [Coelomomyces lativittatus]KAJ1509626.1 hypothetical protein HMI55_007318 [Coelomomyces lativittatus]